LKLHQQIVHEARHPLEAPHGVPVSFSTPSARPPPGKQCSPEPPADMPGLVSRRSRSAAARCASQCGAPSPTNAGTTPPRRCQERWPPSLNLVRRANQLQVVLSHCTTAPPIKMLLRGRTQGASARSLPPWDQLVFRPLESPADVLQQEQPVPYVSLPRLRPQHNWPNRAACWSPQFRNLRAAQPQRRRHLAHSLTRPNHFRQHAFWNAKNAQQLRSHSPHNVEQQRRDALSIRHAFPLVKCQISQLSTRPKAVRPAQPGSRASRCPDPPTLVAENKVKHQPGFDETVSSTHFLKGVTAPAVLRSCQTSPDK